MAVIIQLPKDINRFCRTCMKITDSNKSSFENYIILNDTSTELLEMLQTVTSMNVTPEDDLPKTLCTTCTERIITAYKFIQHAKDVAVNLRSLLVLSENSNEEVEDTKQSDELLTAVQMNESDTTFDYICPTCSRAFTTYYQLSMHTIQHNSNKTLLERFVENQTVEEKISTNVEFDVNIIKLIRELKYSKENSNTPEILGDDIKEKAKVECKICNKKFHGRKDLISHTCTPLKPEEKDPQIKSITTCTLCKKVFSNMSALSLHFIKHALVNSNTCVDTEFFFCEICGLTLDSKSILFKHYDNEHQGKPTWPCPTCPEVHEKECELLIHLVNTHVEENQEASTQEDWLCVLCHTKFASKKILLRHSLEHLMKKYTCKKCFLSYCTQHAYFEHYKLHTQHQHICTTCGKVLGSKSALKSHIVGVHSVDLPHSCVTCGKGFATLTRLRTHMAIHENTKKYVCTICGYGAHKIGDLQIHTRIHTSERPYKCTYVNCSASFKTSSHLCEHVRRHLQIRKFKCSVCLSSFSTRHSLKIHHLQHTGERPHSCSICQQRFRRKYHVSVHMKQHQAKN